MVYQGSCHCGGITFEVGGTVDSALAAVNLRCFEGLDLATIPVHEYDGRAA